MNDLAADLNNTGWTPVKSHSASGQIVQQIRAALFNDELTPGEYLGREKDLAEKFNVSRVPVRDALRTLEAMGIVEIRVGAKGGIYVGKGDPGRFADALAVQLKLVGLTDLELIDAQMAIEGMATELAAQNGTAQDFAELEKIVNDLEGLIDDTAAFVKRSVGFHLAIAAASHSRALNAYLQTLSPLLYARFVPITDSEVARRVWERDKRLLALLKAGARAEARTLMCEHIGRFLGRGKATPD